jgi:hypothetical protein
VDHPLALGAIRSAIEPLSYPSVDKHALQVPDRAKINIKGNLAIILRIREKGH